MHSIACYKHDCVIHGGNDGNMEMAAYEDVVSKLGFALYTPRSQFKY